MSKVNNGKWSYALSRALPLDERVKLIKSARNWRIPARKIARAKKIISIWKSRKPFLREKAFQERLSDLGIDERTLCEAIAFPVTHAVRRHVEQRREWASFKHLIRGHRAQQLYPEEVRDKIGFAYVVLPLIEQHMSIFRQELREIRLRDSCGIFNEEQVCKRFLDDLIHQANWIVEKTCLLELRVAKLRGLLNGKSAVERFESFLSLLRSPLFAGQLLQEYPVLLKDVTSRLSMLHQNTLRFVRCLTDDYSSIKKIIFQDQTLGIMTDFESGNGDSHCGGKSVLKATFDSGKKLVYKPRSLSVDLGFISIIDWCNENLPDRQLRAVRSIDQGTHGWSEHIEHKEFESESEIGDFFYKQGKFIALFYALQANDLHCENMIASGPDPVYVDLETLFHVPPSISPLASATDFINAPPATVLDTYILPIGWRASGDVKHLDISIFRADPDQELPRGVSCQVMSGTDEARWDKKTATLGVSSHLPVYRGTPVAPERFVGDVCLGFSDCYKMLMRESDVLIDLLPGMFQSSKVRHLVRPTSLYFSLIANSLHPDNSRNEMDRRAVFERLFMDVKNHWVNKFLNSESEDLASLDVPYFYRCFESSAIFNSRGGEIPGLSLPCPKTVVNHQLSRLCTSDLSAQLRLIESSLFAHDDPQEHTSFEGSCEFVNGEFGSLAHSPVEGAIEIAENLRKTVVCSGDDRYWMCQTIRGESLVISSPNQFDLYDGQLGIIFFLGMVAAVTGLSEYEELSLQGLATVRRWTQGGRAGFSSIGIYTGSMGYAYVLVNLGICLAREDLVREAIDWVVGFDPDSSVDGLDVIGGAAGCIIFLSNLLKAKWLSSREALRVVELIGIFAIRLSAESKVEALGVSWRIPTKPDRALTGFAHGNAGFSAALFVSAAVLQDESYRLLGWKAIQFENMYYSNERGGWRNLMGDHDGDEVNCAWCNGASGIVLGRLISLEYGGRCREFEPTLSADLCRGMEITTNQSGSNNDSLCHGAIGDFDVMELAKRYAGVEKWSSSAEGKFWNIPVKNRRCGGIGRVIMASQWASPGLMVGAAGIGYGLLRHFAPGLVPSVLGLGVAETVVV